MSDIVEVINHYIEVNPVGDKYKALCPFHNEKTPSLTIFPETNSWYCFGACAEGGDAVDFVQKHEGIGFKEAKKAVEEVLGHEVDVGSGGEKKRSEAKSVAVKPMPKEAIKEFQKDKVFQDLNYRGIRKETDEYFRVLSKVEDGQVVARYYPETREGKLVGYKCRNHPKDFTYGKVGHTGTSNDLAGQFRHKSGGKYVLYTAGEEDLLAAHQMLRDHQIQRNQEDFAPIPVVSPTAGEGSAAKQAAAQYDWFDQFDNIIIGMDNDPAGHKAAKAVAEVLPKEKVKIVTWFNKDPNQMLMQGQQKQFIRDFFGGKEYVKTGIKSSGDAFAEVEEFLIAPKIPLPPHLHRVEEAHRGGLKSSGFIGNIIGDTSVGKSFVTDTLLDFWIPHSQVTPIIVSIERTAGELVADLLSIHLEKNLAWFEDGQRAVDFLHSPEVQEAKNNFLYDDLGRPRFYVLDERDGSLQVLEKKMMSAARVYDTNLFILDPLTDILRSLGNEEQENHMMWQKQRKKEGWKLLNVLHTRKPPASRDGEFKKSTEYDALGSSTFVQSADFNWVLNRNKSAEDLIERNTMTLDIPKVRGGKAGTCVELYFNYQTRRHHDKIDYFSGNHEENN